MNKICVIIPLHKPQLNYFEKISLIQACRVFKERPICFITPPGFNMDCLGFLKGMELGNTRKIEFDSKYFVSTVSYSSLMLSSELYESFADYEYVLICQLDAFPFADRINEFCDMGFDYIGAPCEGPEWVRINAKVGNGGFSLRKTEAVLRVLARKEEIMKSSNSSQKFLQYEDLFFGYCGGRRDIDFNVPDVYTAACFAMQDNVEGSYKKLLSGDNPMGCHGWYRINYDVWKPIIESCGYKLPEVEEVEWFDGARNALLWKKINELESILDTDIPSKLVGNLYSEVSIWGKGEVGTRIIGFLDKLDIAVRDLFDSKKGTVPTEKRLKEAIKPIIVCTIHDKDIKKELRDYDFIEGKDFICVDALLDSILLTYSMK